MASYSELFDLRSDSQLKNRIAVACVIASEAIRSEVETTPNHAARLTWAKSVFANPEREAERMLWAVLSQNASATTDQIKNATDAQIQAKVNEAVDVFAVGS